MMTLRILAFVMAALLLGLTYLLVPFARPDVSRHDFTFDALRVLLLNDAALQRDLLKARAGLLRNYDPLVQSVENLRRAVGVLRSDSEVAGGSMRREIARHIEGIAAAVTDQEALVESFKSYNALLQNSLIYFGYTARQFETASERGSSASEVGTLANAMLRFLSDPQGDTPHEVTASLDRLAGSVGDDADPRVRALLSHGRLIVATLPVVDDHVSRLLEGSTTERTRALQDVYLEAHAHAVAHASSFGMLLYTAALALAAYVAYLFLRLRANARMLRARLDFEHLIAGISAQFINLPSDRFADGINDALARLATHAAVDQAHILIHGGDGASVKHSYVWRSVSISTPACRLDNLLGMALRWTLQDYERQGCIHVPDVQALPDGPEKSLLQDCGIRSWLCIPMWCGGQRIGFLTLEAVSNRKHWPDHDIALSRTAGEILANAIERRFGELEREALETRLHQAQRLESIGTLAGGIAHEFNNILGAIFGYAELALTTLARGGRPERHVQRIVAAGERAKAVIDQILTFSRRSERQVRTVSAEAAVAEAVELLRASLPATVAIETTLNVGGAAVMADPTELQQVVMNLCTNGAHAMQNRGTLHVSLELVEATDALTLSHGSVPAGRYVRLAVTDTGSGIDTATLARIMEPFFTTKAVGQGTGLGLSTVHGIVTQHGGGLNVNSRLGEGSTFEAYFPHSGEVMLERNDAEATALPRGNGETVLVLDDDESLVPLAEEMLAALGYEAVGFNQSAAALEAFYAAPDRFDLVLTDDIMPGMTGTDVATALHEVRPDLPVILMTGGGRRIDAHRLRASGICEIVRKPLLSATLADALARNLSRRARTAEGGNIAAREDEAVT
jgi:signal transduction histidine kinase/ActR/RegA family two-component response regulator